MTADVARTPLKTPVEIESGRGTGGFGCQRAKLAASRWAVRGRGQANRLSHQDPRPTSNGTVFSYRSLPAADVARTLVSAASRLVSTLFVSPQSSTFEWEIRE
jgi:hypothetical protein